MTSCNIDDIGSLRRERTGFIGSAFVVIGFLGITWFSLMTFLGIVGLGTFIAYLGFGQAREGVCVLRSLQGAQEINGRKIPIVNVATQQLMLEKSSGILFRSGMSMIAMIVIAFFLKTNWFL